MKKPAIVIIILVVIAAGAYAIFHKSSKPASSTGNSSQSSNAPAVNNAVLITKTDSNLGQYLADPSGKALYTYDQDTKNVSNCTGSCLATWPAYVAKGSTSDLPTGVGAIKRSDNGQMQYTYNGLPLYYFASDKPGEVTGNGVENFSVAKPSGSSSSSESSSSPDTSNSSGSDDGSSHDANDDSNSSPNYDY